MAGGVVMGDSWDVHTFSDLIVSIQQVCRKRIGEKRNNHDIRMRQQKKKLKKIRTISPHSDEAGLVDLVSNTFSLNLHWKKLKEWWSKRNENAGTRKIKEKMAWENIQKSNENKNSSWLELFV